MQLIAHRGSHLDHPENTLAAFAASVDAGVLAVETDLRLAADGQVVLFHDRFVGPSSVESLTRAQLSARAGHAVPTLAEALIAFPQIHWMLELKTPGVLPASLEVLAAFAASHQLTLISFWHALIVEAAAAIDIPLGFSLGHASIGYLDAANAARGRHGRINTIVWNYEFLDVGLLQRAQRDSWRNLVFNTFCESDDRQCESLAVDGLITDRLARSAPVGELPRSRGHR